MNDDLGRGMLAWTPERWVALDAIASEVVNEHVVLREFFEYREEAGAHTVRISGHDIQVKAIMHDFTFDMQNEDDEDLERKVRDAAQQLALCEDDEAIGVLDLTNPMQTTDLKHQAFINAKGDLVREGVQHGFGVVVSAEALRQLETDAQGVKSGLEIAESVLGASFAQTNSLPRTNDIHAAIFQATPATYRMVRVWGPRLRVKAVRVPNGEHIVSLRLEEGIAVGKIKSGRCLGIQLVDNTAGAKTKV